MHGDGAGKDLRRCLLLGPLRGHAGIAMSDLLLGTGCSLLRRDYLRKIPIAQAIRPRFLFGITCDMGCYQDRNVMA